MMNIRIIPILLTFSLILSSALPIVHANEETTASSPDDTTESEEKEDADASDTDCAVVEKSGPEKEVSPGSTSDETDAPISGKSAGAVTDFETKTGDGPENTPTLEKTDDSIIDAPSTGIPITDTFSTAPNTDDVSSSIEAAPMAATTDLPNPESPLEKTATPAKEDTDSLIIISEIQTGGDVTNDDFVELYNPNDAPLPLKGFELRRKTKGDATEKGSLFHSFSDTDAVPGKGFFLWANKEGTVTFIALADVMSLNKTSPSLTDDNSLALFAADKSMIDSVTWGSGHSRPFSPTVNDNPDKNTSLVRDPKSLSWSISKCPTPKNRQGETVDTSVECKPPTALPTVGTIVINELYPNPTAGENEWIELRNTTDADASIAGWKLKDASTSAGYTFPTGSDIGAHGFLVVGADISKIALNNTGTESLTLLFPDGSVADSFTYNGTEKGASYAKTDSGIFLLTHLPTRGERNDFDPIKIVEPAPPIGTIRINEIFPNPKEKGEANEWIELRNSGSEPVSLLGWTLRSGSGKFTWTEKLPDEQMVLPAGGFLVLPRSLTRLALRNTNGTLSLVAPDGVTTMDSVAYDKTTESASYGLFESARFRWSKTLTPGSDNVFGKEPNVKKSTIPKKGYRGVLVPFSATGNKKGMKYVWDFGDGHKSYLEATSHRFVKTGTYEGFLTLRDGIEETVKPFTIRIGKYPNRNIHLTELCPNPAGNDTGNEWVRIRNDDTKRIDLSGWIIASATEKTKLVNHVILTDRTIGPGEEIVLTRADSRFTLPNERAVIELRRPDGKAVQTIEYVQDGGATENAVFTEIDDSVWTWSAPETDRDIPMLSSADNETESDDIEEAEPFEAGMSADPDSDRLTFGEFVSLGTPYDPVLPDSLSRVLGTSDERLTNEGSASESFLDLLFRILNGLLYVEK